MIDPNEGWGPSVPSFGMVALAVGIWLFWIGFKFSQRFPRAARQNAADSLYGLILMVAIAGMVIGLVAWAWAKF